MKDSSKYAKKVMKLFSSLKKASQAPKEPEYEDPIDSIVHGILSEYITLKDAKSAQRKIESHFVDLNDLRVSRTEEIVEVLGINKEVGAKIAAEVTNFLNIVFDRYDAISLDVLQDLGKRQARKDLEDLGCISKFAVGYCFLTALKGHAIPLTEPMVNYLQENELVYPGADSDTIEGFLERQISSSDGYTFYYLLREESEKSPGKSSTAAKTTTTKKKTTVKKAPAAKTTAAKKKTTRKKTAK